MARKILLLKEEKKKAIRMSKILLIPISSIIAIIVEAILHRRTFIDRLIVINEKNDKALEFIKFFVHFLLLFVKKVLEIVVGIFWDKLSPK